MKFNVRLPKFRKQQIVQDQKGITLIEVLVAVVMVGIIVAGVIMVIGTSTKILVTVKNKEIAKDIASSDMEYIRSQLYRTTYALPTLPAIYAGFTVDYGPNTQPIYINNFEQQIDLYVYLRGTQIFKLTDYRVDY